MPKEIIFHVGLPKTATTYFQKYIWPQLEKDGWIIVDPFFNNTKMYKDFARVWHYFNHKKFNNKKIIVSSEYLSDPFRDYQYNKAGLQKLKKIYPKSKTIIFTREIKAHINSLYLQTIKTGSAIPASKFMRERKILNLDPWNLIILKNYVDYVFKFEDLKSTPVSLLYRLSKLFNFKFKYVKEDTNTSFGIISAPVCRFFNHFLRSRNNPHGFIPLPYRPNHLFTYLRRYKWFRKIDKKKNYFN